MIKEIIMNTDQVKGKLKEVAGEIQEHVGRFFGSDEQEQKGHEKEMQGKAQQQLGDYKEAHDKKQEELSQRLQNSNHREPIEPTNPVRPLEPSSPIDPPVNPDYPRKPEQHNVPLSDPDGVLTIPVTGTDKLKRDEYNNFDHIDNSKI